MAKNYVLPIFLTMVAVLHQTQMIVNGAPFDNEDHNAIIVIPFRSSDKQITKIESFKIDGETAVKQLSSRVSAEKILRTLSNVPEFSILVEGLDAITLGDVYKTAFPNGILHSISENYLQSPSLGDNKAAINKPYNLEAVKSTEIVADNEVEDTGIASEYDEVNEDDEQLNNEDLKEEPITDDYVYDQPVEDRFFGDGEYITRQNNETDNNDTRDSKNMNYTLSESIDEVGHRKKELNKYGAWFRYWITKFLAG